MKDKYTAIVRMLEWGTIFSTCGLIFTVILQILTRQFFMEITPSWTEEVSRFFFIYTISFGAGLAQKGGYFVSMDYFYRRFNDRIRWMIDAVVLSVSAVLFLLMSVCAVNFIVTGLEETSPGIGIPMSVAFASMLIMSGSVLYFILVELIHMIKSEIK